MTEIGTPGLVIINVEIWLKIKIMSENKKENKGCGCFWNGGNWFRFCDKHLKELKNDLKKIPFQKKLDI